MGYTLSKYLRVILSALFAIAGTLKLIQPTNLKEVILYFELAAPSKAGIIVLMIGISELALALFLLLNYKPQLINSITVMICLVFVIIALVGYKFNWSLACGCLGDFKFGQFDKLMIFRNVSLLLISIVLLVNNTKTKNKHNK